jgi:hypothetical protein
MQRYTAFVITVNVLHVSGGFSARHQKLKTVHTASGKCQACLLLPLAVAASKFDIIHSIRKKVSTPIKFKFQYNYSFIILGAI